MTANRDWFAQPRQSDRLSRDYGRTVLDHSDDRLEVRRIWIAAALVGLMVYVAIVAMAAI
ncbi:hypothetical protein LZK98_11405 [Sphingomonas cannabina]|uniref:hypothetical protein n=1 Tax=Sphingomonas cannabina TaxID=2899123 RepID=UPI001F1D56A2|nr:hypothetical protein [Sphingomonas cannabina]UIJ43696.1 hypothetical protein LZK98_11405 [Sphingomonas cannabina]